MSSWKSNCLVHQVFRLPGCGKLLNVPVQLDFLERIMDDTELFNSYVEVCEKKFVEGDPHFKKYELKKPAEHSYSKNYSDRDSEMDEIDNIIKSLQKMSSDDESVIALSGEDTTMRQEKTETEKTKTQTETEIVPRRGYSHSPSIERTLDEKNDTKSPSSSSSRSPQAKGGKEPREMKRDRHYYKNQIRLHRDQHNLQEYQEEGNESREEEDESHGASTMFPNERTDTLKVESHERRKSHPEKTASSRSHHPMASHVKKSRLSRKDDWNSKNDPIKLKSKRDSPERLTRYPTKRDDSRSRSPIRNKSLMKQCSSGKKDANRRSPYSSRPSSTFRKSEFSHSSNSEIDSSNESSQSSSPIRSKSTNMKNKSLKDLVKQSRKAVNLSYGSYTSDGKLAKGKSAVKCQQVEFYCLRKLENPIRIPGDEEEIKLANASLGSKVIDVPLDHSSREMQQLILSNFPSLKGDFILACKMKKSDKILDPFFKVVPSMAQLMQRVPSKSSTVYVVPYDEIDVADREDTHKCRKCKKHIKLSKRFEHHMKCNLE